MVLGNGKAEWTCYNARLQAATTRLGAASPTGWGASATDLLRLDYSYSATRNNGDLTGQTIARGFPAQSPASWSVGQRYTYDELDRLKTAGEGVNLETYSYDAVGNRWTSARNGALPAIGPELLNQVGSPFVASTNRVNTWGYDNAGNLESILGAARTFTYDAENRQTTAVTAGGSAAYDYDGEGRRVKKTTGSQTTIFVYDAMGRLAQEVAAGPTMGIRYMTADALGSMRLETDGAGNAARCRDYLPFGEELTYGRPVNWPCFGNAAGQSVRFTGKERDGETGLDYFGARYFSGAQGRFTSPDPKGFSIRTIGNPQKWNKYAYVLNNPLALVDPDGLEEVRVTYRAFIPTATASVAGFTYSGDNRGFSTAANASSRIAITVTVETDPRVRSNPLVGERHMMI